jgi:dipeptidyl aminopeptidase/acylaminoacyl peptidase
VVDVHGVHDFARLAADGPGHKASVAFLGGTIEQRPAAWAEASPIRRVGADSAPMLLTHDPGDKVVPFEQSTRFAAALIGAGRPCEFIPTPGSGHGFVYNIEGEWSRRIWPLACAWLRQWLGK